NWRWPARSLQAGGARWASTRALRLPRARPRRAGGKRSDRSVHDSVRRARERRPLHLGTHARAALRLSFDQANCFGSFPALVACFRRVITAWAKKETHLEGQFFSDTSSAVLPLGSRRYGSGCMRQDVNFSRACERASCCLLWSVIESAPFS